MIIPASRIEYDVHNQNAGTNVEVKRKNKEKYFLYGKLEKINTCSGRGYLIAVDLIFMPKTGCIYFSYPRLMKLAIKTATFAH